MNAKTQPAANNPGAPETRFCNPQIKIKKFRKGRCYRLAPGIIEPYSIRELKILLKQQNYIWGFEPFSGQARLLDRQKIQDAVEENKNRSVIMLFGFDKGRVGTVKLVPTVILEGPRPVA